MEAYIKMQMEHHRFYAHNDDDDNNEYRLPPLLHYFPCKRKKWTSLKHLHLPLLCLYLHLSCLSTGAFQPLTVSLGLCCRCVFTSNRGQAQACVHSYNTKVRRQRRWLTLVRQSGLTSVALSAAAGSCAITSPSASATSTHLVIHCNSGEAGGVYTSSTLKFSQSCPKGSRFRDVARKSVQRYSKFRGCVLMQPETESEREGNNFFRNTKYQK